MLHSEATSKLVLHANTICLNKYGIPSRKDRKKTTSHGRGQVTLGTFSARTFLQINIKRHTFKHNSLIAGGCVISLSRGRENFNSRVISLNNIVYVP